MRKLLLSFFGLCSTLIGLLVALSRIERMWLPQMIFSELAWFPGLMGSLVAVASLRLRAPVGWAFGLLGAALSFMTYWRLPAALSNMAASMRQGFGDDYESCIPPEALRRMTRTRLSALNSLGRQYGRNGIRAILDIPYVERSTRTLKLDLYEPTVPPIVGTRYPVILVLHGGGWRTGNKGDFSKAHSQTIAAQGYVVIDAQYRYSTESIWSAQLDDVRDALRWIRAHADRYKIDPRKIVLMGRSAGGHLALQAAYRAVDNHADTQVVGVIALYAPTDMHLLGATHDERVVSLMGGTSYEVPEVYTDASVLHFAHGDHLPPTLLAHGYRDETVPASHSEMLLNRLRVNGTPSAMLRVPWGRHGFDALMPGIGAQLTQYYIDRFLAWSVYR